jgi:hypothetical protein
MPKTSPSALLSALYFYSYSFHLLIIHLSDLGHQVQEVLFVLSKKEFKMDTEDTGRSRCTDAKQSKSKAKVHPPDARPKRQH